MFEKMMRRRARKREIAEIDAFIQRVQMEELKNAKTSKERHEAYQLAYAMCAEEYNEREYLRQEELLQAISRAPFEVPKDYWNEADYGRKATLTNRGRVWAQHELKKQKRSDVEFWAKIVLPVLSMIVSIIALLKK